MNPSYAKALLRRSLGVAWALRWVILLSGVLLGIAGGLQSAQEGLEQAISSRLLVPVRICFKTEKDEAEVIKRIKTHLPPSSRSLVTYESSVQTKRRSAQVLARLLNHKIDDSLIEGLPCATVRLDLSSSSVRRRIPALMREFQSLEGVDFLLTSKILSPKEGVLNLLASESWIKTLFNPFLFSMVLVVLFLAMELLWHKRAKEDEVAIYFGATWAFVWVPMLAGAMISGAAAGLLGELTQLAVGGILKGSLFEQLGIDVPMVFAPGRLFLIGTAGGLVGALLGMRRHKVW